MLWLKVVNIFTDADDVADYRWEAGVNDKLLGEGRVLEHRRAEGAGALIRKIGTKLEKMQKQKEEEGET